MIIFTSRGKYTYQRKLKVLYVQANRGEVFSTYVNKEYSHITATTKAICAYT